MTEPSASPRPDPLRLDGAFPRRDLEDWLAAAEASLKGGATLDSLARESADGLSIPVLCHDSPVTGRVTPARTDAGGSSEAVEPAWDNRLRVLGETPAEAAAHALAGLAGGVTSLEIAVGTGDARSPGTLPVDALPAALDGVHLEMIGLALRAGEASEAAVDALLALCRKRGLDPAAARVELDADPLGELARHGRVAGGLDAARTRLCELAVRGARELPSARLVTIDTTVHHAAGATPVQELVAGIAAGTAALDALLDAGLAPEAALDTLGFRVALDADIIGGVVKLRALERLWRHALAGAGLPDRRAPVLAETSRRQLSRLAPWINHLRNVAACSAAAIGGVDTIMVHPHDRVDGRRIGDDAAAADRVAWNLPVLLAEEGGLLAVADAAGGAHAIESLTQATVEAAWSALGDLQGTGGLGAALERGEWQAAVARSHAERVARLAEGERVRVGVNRFRHDGAEAPLTSPVARTAGAGAIAETGPGAAGRDGDVAPLVPVRDARAFEDDGEGRRAGASGGTVHEGRALGVSTQGGTA